MHRLISQQLKDAFFFKKIKAKECLKKSKHKLKENLKLQLTFAE